MQDYPAVTTISGQGTVQKIIELQHYFILVSNQSLQGFTLFLVFFWIFFFFFIAAAKDASFWGW